MQSPRRASHLIGWFCTGAALLIVTAPAGADEEKSEEPRRRVAGELVKALEKPEREDGWFGPHFHTHKRHGFEYRRSFTTRGKKRIEFSVQGPLVKKKSPGLAFEIRF